MSKIFRASLEDSSNSEAEQSSIDLISDQDSNHIDLVDNTLQQLENAETNIVGISTESENYSSVSDSKVALENAQNLGIALLVGLVVGLITKALHHFFFKDSPGYSGGGNSVAANEHTFTTLNDRKVNDILSDASDVTKGIFKTANPSLLRKYEDKFLSEADNSLSIDAKVALYYIYERAIFPHPFLSNLVKQKFYDKVIELAEKMSNGIKEIGELSQSSMSSEEKIKRAKEISEAINNSSVITVFKSLIPQFNESRTVLQKGVSTVSFKNEARNYEKFLMGISNFIQNLDRDNYHEFFRVVVPLHKQLLEQEKVLKQIEKDFKKIQFSGSEKELQRIANGILRIYAKVLADTFNTIDFFNRISSGINRLIRKFFNVYKQIFDEIQKDPNFDKDNSKDFTEKYEKFKELQKLYQQYLSNNGD